MRQTPPNRDLERQSPPRCRREASGAGAAPLTRARAPSDARVGPGTVRRRGERAGLRAARPRREHHRAAQKHRTHGRRTAKAKLHTRAHAGTHALRMHTRVAGQVFPFETLFLLLKENNIRTKRSIQCQIISETTWERARRLAACKAHGVRPRPRRTPRSKWSRGRNLLPQGLAPSEACALIPGDRCGRERRRGVHRPAASVPHRPAPPAQPRPWPSTPPAPPTDSAARGPCGLSGRRRPRPGGRQGCVWGSCSREARRLGSPMGSAGTERGGPPTWDTWPPPPGALGPPRGDPLTHSSAVTM